MEQAPGMLQSALQSIISKLDKLTGMMPRGKEEEVAPSEGVELGESKELEVSEDDASKEMGEASPVEEAVESPDEECEEDEGKPAHLVALDAIFKKSAK